MSAELRVLELFCGIGGAAVALEGKARVVRAIDINRLALAAYAANHLHPVAARTLESLSAAELGRAGADLWWMSPPCQPFTRRGLGRDDEDPRSQGLLALARHIPVVRPPFIALENVPGFAGSRSHAKLSEALAAGGYEASERLLCPSELGMPNRRLRFYLVASREGLAEPQPLPRVPITLRSCLEWPPEEGAPAELALDPALAQRYRHAIDVVDAADPAALTACFTSAYGRSPVRSGSYLATSGLATSAGLRRFSPREILSLLGFPPAYRLPADLPLANAWRLAGNSLSVPAVREVLRALPGWEGPDLASPSGA